MRRQMAVLKKCRARYTNLKYLEATNKGAIILSTVLRYLNLFIDKLTYLFSHEQRKKLITVCVFFNYNIKMNV